MTQISIAHLPDGRSVEYDPDNLEHGGIMTDAFYLSVEFTETDFRLWIRDHKNIEFKSFGAGAVLIGQRVIDRDELDYVLRIAVSPQDQFFQQTLDLVME